MDVDETHVMELLRERLGEECVLSSPAERYVYATDASRRRGSCLGVVRPRREEDVVTLIETARDEGFHVVPRGAGTCSTGSALPLGRAVVLDLTGMNRILDVDPGDMVAVVEPGVITGELQAAVEARGLFYPPDPASSRFSTIGGNVATCAGGLRAVKYGVTRDYVLGLRCVLANASVIQVGGRALKDVAGYDLVRLLVGSEGTLAVFTRIILKLLPAPAARATLVGTFSHEKAALTAADRILASGLLPRAIEFLDREVLAIVARFKGESPREREGAQLLVEVDGGETQVTEDAQRIRRTLLDAGALEVSEARSEEERSAVWETRRSISAAVFRATPAKASEDVGVPRGHLAEALEEIRRAGRRHGIRILCYGHAGDANLHCNFLYDPADRDVRDRLRAAREEVFGIVMRRGGTLTGEHGVGLSKLSALERFTSREVLNLQAGIKEVFDPHGILNPGKAVPGLPTGPQEGE